jgi:predicted Rossmann fold nucleotide-binding protein DprA/Smf involved in DNA uptake
MQTRIIPITDDTYPPQVTEWFKGKTAPTLYTSGNQGIFNQPPNIQIALFSGRKCPGSLLLPAMDTAATLRDHKHTVISGFHSPLEQECLQVLLPGDQAVIACPARSIQNMRLPQPWKQSYQNERLLVLSRFPEEKKR